MSSLLQFTGRFKRTKHHRGAVALQMCHRDKDYVPLEPQVRCTICGELHEQIYEVSRVPCGMIGCWVQFRYNGEVHAPDLSVPISVTKLPRDAEKLSQEENSLAWHDKLR